MTSTRFRSLSDPQSLLHFASALREGIYITTRDGRVLDANPAFLDTVGIQSLGDLGETGVFSLFVDPARREEKIALLDRDGSMREFEIAMRRPDGESRTVLDTCYLIRDDETGDEFIHGIIVDITSRKRLEADLLEMSTHDVLTGALNRRYLLDLEERFTKDPKLRCGCIFVDIDRFKAYNDSYGHAAGDDALKRLARFLMRHTRTEEAVVRLGGDEFVVILHGADAGETHLVAERLRSQALERAPVAFSLGWAAREGGESAQALLDRADRSMMAVRVIKRNSDPRAQPAFDG